MSFPYNGAEREVCIELDNHDGTTSCRPLYGGDPVTRAHEAVRRGEAIACMYSVYWRLEMGGVEHVADFPLTDDGLEKAGILVAAMRVYALLYYPSKTGDSE